jgi:hypothetical protein
LPWGDPAFQANLSSAAYAVLAVGAAFSCAHQLSGDWLAGFVAGLALGVSHAFWLHAVRAEVYTLHLFLFLTGLWALLRWSNHTREWAWLVLAGAAWFAGATNHLLTLLALPGGLWIVATRSRSSLPKRTLVWTLAGIVAGALILNLLFPTLVRDLIPESLRYVAASFAVAPRRLILDAVLLAYQFPFSGLLIVPGALWLRRKRAIASAGFVVTAFPIVCFAATFQVPDSYVFYLPLYALLAVLSGVGILPILSRISRHHVILFAGAAIALQVGLYRFTPTILDRVAPNVLGARDLPGRPATEFFLWPSKRGDEGSRRFADATLGTLPAHSVLAADWTLYTPLSYLQKVEGRRHDVTLLEMSSTTTTVLIDNRHSRPIFLADDYVPYYSLHELGQFFELQPAGLAYRLTPRDGTP